MNSTRHILYTNHNRFGQLPHYEELWDKEYKTTCPPQNETELIIKRDEMMKYSEEQFQYHHCLYAYDTLWKFYANEGCVLLYDESEKRDVATHMLNILKETPKYAYHFDYKTRKFIYALTGFQA